jgi:hypothetical protein
MKAKAKRVVASDPKPEKKNCGNVTNILISTSESS